MEGELCEPGQLLRLFLAYLSRMKTKTAAPLVFPLTIVLVRVTMDGVRETGKMERFDGVNWRPSVESCPKAEALVWVNEGVEEDLQKAADFAKAEGYTVRTFETAEANPLGKARADALASREAGDRHKPLAVGN